MGTKELTNSSVRDKEYIGRLFRLCHLSRICFLTLSRFKSLDVDDDASKGEKANWAVEWTLCVLVDVLVRGFPRPAAIISLLIPCHWGQSTVMYVYMDAGENQVCLPPPPSERLVASSCCCSLLQLSEFVFHATRKLSVTIFDAEIPPLRSSDSPPISSALSSSNPAHRKLNEQVRWELAVQQQLPPAVPGDNATAAARFRWRCTT